MTLPRDQLFDLADDYVLGLLTPAEAEALEAEMARDAALAAHVGRSRDALLPLDMSAAPADLPEDFAGRVLGAAGGGGQPSNVVAFPEPNRRGVLQLLAASLAGAAIGLGVGWQRPDPDPIVVAVLLDENGVPQAVIEDYGNATATVRFVADVEVPPDRTMELWTLPNAEMGPTSLGTLDGVRPAVLTGADLPRPGEQQLYEITFEPLGGSPTGRPTGPILGKGFAATQDGT